MSKTKYLLAALGVFAIVAYFGVSNYGQDQTSKFLKPYAQSVDDEEEEELEECADCGEEEEEEEEEPATPATPATPAKPACEKDTWSCGDWGTCSEEGKQARSCKLTFDCESASTAKPAESQKCTPPPPACEKDTWKCGSWSACSKDGLQTRGCSMTDDCESAKTPSPAESQKCTPPVEEKPAPAPVEEEKEVVRPAAEEPQIEVAPQPIQQVVPEQSKVEEPKPEAPKPEEPKPEEPKIEESKAEEQKVETPTPAATNEEAAPAPIILLDEIKVDEKVVVEEAQKITEQNLAEIAARERAAAEAQRLEQEVPAFKQIVETSRQAPAPSVAAVDLNNNGTPDEYDKFLNVDPKKPDQELVRKEAELSAKKKKIVESGASAQEAEKVVRHELQKFRAQKKVRALDAVADKKYNIRNPDDKQRTAIALGVDPRASDKADSNFSPIEAALYGVDGADAMPPDPSAMPPDPSAMPPDPSAMPPDPSAMPQRVAMGLRSGSQVPTRGGTVLAAGRAGRTYNLVAVDRSGVERTVATEVASDNNKIAFSPERELAAGQYMMQVREAAPAGARAAAPERAGREPAGRGARGVPGGMGRAGRTSALNADEAPSESLGKSAPALVTVVDDPSIPSPIVRTIQNIEVVGRNDIKVTATADGKIRVTGSSDLESTVIGTFKSAVFTAAIIAGVENGGFEVVSPKALPDGDHEVIIYASRPEQGNQSQAVKVRFSIVESANAAGEKTVVVGERPAANEKGFPVIPVAAGAVVIIAIGVGVALKKKSA